MTTKRRRRLTTRTMSELASRADVLDAWLELDDLDLSEIARLYREARALGRRLRGAELDTRHRRHYARRILGTVAGFEALARNRLAAAA